jgi:hypothetical protein
MAASLWDKNGLGDVILSISDGAVQVEQKIQSAAFEGNLGTTGKINVQGEIAQRLDSIGNYIFVDRLIATGSSLSRKVRVLQHQRRKFRRLGKACTACGNCPPGPVHLAIY